MKTKLAPLLAFAACVFASVSRAAPPTTQPLAIRAEKIYTMSGDAIDNGVILLREGKIESVGRANDIQIPNDIKILQAKVVTPGLIDAHTVLGLQGYRNEPREQDQLEKSAPIQPELRALDAFNGRERLLEWVRGFGITTIHTGPQPGELVPGQTMIIKTRGPTVDDGLLKATAMLTITLGDAALAEDRGKSPGTRPKEIAMLRAELIKAKEYDQKRARAATQPATNPADDETPSRDLRQEVFVRVVKKELPVLVTAHRAQDILLALKLAKEFDLNLVLDGASEAYLLIDQIKAAGVPVLLHPTMFRSTGEAENLSMGTASKLRAAGIPFAIQSAYEAYVPKTRVVLFEAAVAASNGLKREDALASITIDAAKIIGVSDRVGSIEKGKDADLALFDGDPFEYTTHCTTTIIDGLVVSEKAN
ncbi:MAG: amidohydrolase family protein [Anaerolineae bacterium]|nr:amidohydrolase family protein [Phycisphaerae bacterium]